MQRIKLSSVILLTVGSLLAEAINVWDGDSEAPDDMLRINLKRQFEKINEYLVEKVDTNQKEPNMKKAEELYNQLLSESFYSSKNKKMIQALELFLALVPLDNQALCNMESYRILLQNDLSSDSAAHQDLNESGLKKLNRVQTIIHDAGVRHAENCYSRYPNWFKDIYYKMDQAMVEKVAKVLDQYIINQSTDGPGSNSEKIYNRFVFQPEAMGVWNFAKSIYENMDDLPKYPSSSNRVLSLLNKKGIHKKKTRQLYKERVLAPCDYFVRQLKHIFIPARYDAVFHREDDDDDYYLSWARFRLCNSLINLDRGRLVNQINAIHKETLAKEAEN